MASVNQMIIVGRLGKDVELKSSQGGKPYAFFSVATDDYVGKDKEGKSQTETTWHECKVFGQQAEYLSKYGKKGSTVYVAGRLEKKKDDKGLWVNVISDRIIVLGSSNGNSTGNSNETAGEAQAQSSQEDRGATRTGTQAPPVANQATQSVAANTTAPDDDLPF